MTWTKYDKLPIGILVGVVAPFLGFLLYGMYYTWEYNVTLNHYIYQVFLGTKNYQSPIISLSLIADLGVFFLALKLKLNHVAKGIVYALMMYAPLVVYLRFF